MDPFEKFQSAGLEFEKKESKAKADAEKEKEKNDKENIINNKIKKIKQTLKENKKEGLNMLDLALKNELSYNKLQDAGKIDNYKSRLRNLIKGENLNITGSSKKGMSLKNKDGTVYDSTLQEGAKSFLVSGPKKIKKPTGKLPGEKNPIEAKPLQEKLGPKTLSKFTEEEKDKEFGTAIFKQEIFKEREKQAKKRISKKTEEKKKEENRLLKIKEYVDKGGDISKVDKKDLDKIKKIKIPEKKDIYGLKPEETKPQKKLPRAISAKVAAKVSEQMKKAEDKKAEDKKIKEMLFKMAQNPDLMKVKKQESKYDQDIIERDYKEPKRKETRKETRKEWHDREIAEVIKEYNDSWIDKMIEEQQKVVIEEEERKYKKAKKELRTMKPQKMLIPPPSTPTVKSPSGERPAGEGFLSESKIKELEDKMKKIKRRNKARETERETEREAKTAQKEKLDEIQKKRDIRQQEAKEQLKQEKREIRQQEAKAKYIISKTNRAWGEIIRPRISKKPQEDEGYIEDIEEFGEFGLDEELDDIDKQQLQFQMLGEYRPLGWEKEEKERKDYYSDIRSRDPMPQHLQYERDFKHNMQDKFINRQDKFLNPGDYVSDEEPFGQELVGENKLIDRIEIYEQEVKAEIGRLAVKRDEAIREGKLDPNIPYTIGDYNEMFNYTDENKQQKRERNREVIDDFMRENNISSSVLQGNNLNDLSDRALRHIAVSVGIGEDSVSRFQGAADLYEIARKEGIVSKVIDSERVKGTMIGKALKQIDNEGYEENGNFKNIGEKIANIFDAMTVPVKIMAGISDVSDIKRTYKGLAAGRDIGKGIYNVITSTVKKEEPKDEPKKEDIMQELQEIRNGRSGDKGLSYPKSENITPYYYPKPSENWDGVRLIQNSVSSYLNDENLYGGSYTNIYNEI
jgi:hypothetical protein